VFVLCPLMSRVFVDSLRASAITFASCRRAHRRFRLDARWRFGREKYAPNRNAQVANQVGVRLFVWNA